MVYPKIIIIVYSLDNTAYAQKFVHANVRPYREPLLACTYGRGARVAIKCADFNEHSHDDPKMRRDQAWFTGTVLGFANHQYEVRIDNSTRLVKTTLALEIARPECLHRYKNGTKLMLLHDEMDGEMKWVDGTVVKYLGRQNGTLHKIQLDRTGESVEVDLNRFNHTTQLLQSAAVFQTERGHYRDNLTQLCSHIKDPITGRALHVFEQTVSVGLAPKYAAQQPPSAQTFPEDMEGLANVLASSSGARTSGAFATPSFLIIGKAGTGKTWGMQQLVYALAKASSEGLEGLPLVIRTHILADIAKKFENQRQEKGKESSFADHLMRQYIHDAYHDDKKQRDMLLMALGLQALVLIVDGMDEFPELRELLPRLFAEELSTRRFRFVVTSRPSEELDHLRFRRYGCHVLGLQPLTHTQIYFAVEQQLNSKIDDHFFLKQLFALRTLRSAQDALFEKMARSGSPQHKQIISLGNDRDAFQNAKKQFIPTMRQNSLTFAPLSVVSGPPYKSEMLRVISTFFHKDGLLQRLQTLVDEDIEDNDEQLDNLLIELCPEAFSDPKIPSEKIKLSQYDSHSMSKLLDALPIQSFPVLTEGINCDWCMLL